MSEELLMLIFPLSPFLVLAVAIGIAWLLARRRK